MPPFQGSRFMFDVSIIISPLRDFNLIPHTPYLINTYLAARSLVMKKIFLFLLLSFPSLLLSAQHEGHSMPAPTTVKDLEAQPLLSQVLRLQEALVFLGSSLSAKDVAALKALQQKKHGSETIAAIQQILDPYCLAIVDINPEARVKVSRGPAKAVLIKDGWSSFLVKVNNDAGINAALEVASPNAQPAIIGSSFDARVRPENVLTRGQVDNRFLEVSMYHNRPLQAQLSGLKLEYAVLQIYSKDAGMREAAISFNIGQGTQDIGFRNAISILFNISKPVKVILKVTDNDGKPAMASFTITDGIERLLNDTMQNLSTADYRITLAQTEYNMPDKKLKGIYPLPSRRVAAYDEYPDFFFQPQVYRKDGEHIDLPPGTYHVTVTRGPEYLTQTRLLVVPSGVDSVEVPFTLKRWINMSALGWYSADHHVHAAGCSHYESPEEGVTPLDMWRQVQGEDLNVAAVLSWGPGWYHQKENFTGKSDPLSTNRNVMRYDVEVSGFPSSHAGHIVLLRLKEDDYPGTKEIEDWPSWTLPVLRWAKAQNAVVGYAHSGWGLQPVTPTKALPNYVMPKMDGIGANEYIVTSALKAVDFYSAGDTPASWELNMWYHTLNCGFKIPVSGETDFPCIFDERVGMARSYFKPDGALNYESYTDAIKSGRSYVSEGGSHIINFKLNGIESTAVNSELNLAGLQKVKITADIAALLPEKQTEAGAEIAKRPLDQQPYWHLEHARLGTTRKVPVELIVNGVPVDTVHIVADGSMTHVSFNYQLKDAAWMAIRVYPSSHTNPFFVKVAGKPVLVKKSVEWCRKAVDQCWQMKQSRIRKEELPAAESAYKQARQVYDDLLKQAAR